MSTFEKEVIGNDFFYYQRGLVKTNKIWTRPSYEKIKTLFEKIKSEYDKYEKEKGLIAKKGDNSKLSNKNTITEPVKEVKTEQPTEEENVKNEASIEASDEGLNEGVSEGVKPETAKGEIGKVVTFKHAGQTTTGTITAIGKDGRY
jgi:hypothetical protein